MLEKELCTTHLNIITYYNLMILDDKLRPIQKCASRFGVAAVASERIMKERSTEWNDVYTVYTVFLERLIMIPFPKPENCFSLYGHWQKMLQGSFRMQR
jgi:hypothetical protein